MILLSQTDRGGGLMKVGIIGTGRMGKILAQRMAAQHEVYLYDADSAAACQLAGQLQVGAACSLADLEAATVVLAVPDAAVKGCIEELQQQGKPRNVFSVATNISREILAGMAGPTLQCLNVKIIGHAGEMSRGARPVIVADNIDPQLAELACQLFAPVGTVLVAEADLVKTINSVATEEALKAAVAIEQALCAAGIDDPAMITGALSVVAPGVLKAYAEDDLGPFARGIVCALREGGLP
jgi:pyrroline-5-carboxylate reductase